jgi:hypothetical protein
MNALQRAIALPAVAGLAVLAVLGVAAGAAQTKPKEQARLYEETLQGMTGQTYAKVISAIMDWKFQCLDAWEATNPTAKEVAGHNRNKVKFSKKEIAEIFGPGGAFKVVVYNKLVGTDATSMGAVDSMGMTAGKDLNVNVEKYTVIRAVFKDNVLLLAKVWPIVDQSGLSGGMLFRR